jgi:hypothetical protein
MIKRLLIQQQDEESLLNGVDLKQFLKCLLMYFMKLLSSKHS